MNYQKIYDQLIERSRTRIPPEGYIEHHHIIPRCLDGSDAKENIAILTPEEHFIAHQLLVKIYPNNNNLVRAAQLMCTGPAHIRMNNKFFGWLRRKCSTSQKGLLNHAYGKIWINNGIIEKQSSKLEEGFSKGRLPSSMRGCVDNYTVGHITTQETRDKIGKSNAGKPKAFSAEDRNRMRERAIKMSRDDVMKKKRLKTAKANHSKKYHEIDQKMIELWKLGKTDTEIGKTLQIGQRIVSRHLRDMGYSSNWHKK